MKTSEAKKCTALLLDCKKENNPGAKSVTLGCEISNDKAPEKVPQSPYLQGFPGTAKNRISFISIYKLYRSVAARLASRRPPVVSKI